MGILWSSVSYDRYGKLTQSSCCGTKYFYDKNENIIESEYRGVKRKHSLPKLQFASVKQLKEHESLTGNLCYSIGTSIIAAIFVITFVTALYTTNIPPREIPLFKSTAIVMGSIGSLGVIATIYILVRIKSERK